MYLLNTTVFCVVSVQMTNLLMDRCWMYRIHLGIIYHYQNTVKMYAPFHHVEHWFVLCTLTLLTPGIDSVTFHHVSTPLISFLCVMLFQMQFLRNFIPTSYCFIQYMHATPPLYSVSYILKFLCLWCGTDNNNDHTILSRLSTRNTGSASVVEWLGVDSISAIKL